MSDERDRLGEKFRDVEKAREDQWAREEDHKLLEKLRQKQSSELHCPQCKQKLVAQVEAGITAMRCPAGHGMWLDRKTAESLVASLKK